MLEQNKDEIMDTNKATPQEIFEMLEQQKKLQDIRAKLVHVLDKVNQTINSITVSFSPLRKFFYGFSVSKFSSGVFPQVSTQYLNVTTFFRSKTSNSQAVKLTI